MDTPPGSVQCSPHRKMFLRSNKRFKDGKERMSEIQMLDVTIPATDGRELRMKRYTKPEKVHQLLLDQLGFTLPEQPPPEIRTPRPVVETY